MKKPTRNQARTSSLAEVNPWENRKLAAFIQERIESGILKEAHAIDLLYTAILAVPAFAALFSKKKQLLSHAVLAERLRWRAEKEDQCDPLSFLWTKQRSEQFDAYYRLCIDNDKVAKRFHYLPLVAIKNRIRWLRGRGVQKQVVRHISGLFRVLPDDKHVQEVTVEHSHIDQPILIADEICGIVPLTSLNFGLPYSYNMRENIPRCAMETCVREKYAVVIAGGLLHLEIQKAGAYAQRRAQLQASDIDPDMFPEAYRRHVREIMHHDANIPIFMTLMEKFEDRLNGIAKVFRDGKRPHAPARFGVPIFYLLTSGERSLIDTLAYYEVRYQWLLEQRRLAAEVSLLGKLCKVDPNNEMLAREYAEQLEVLDHSRLLSHVSDDNRKRATERLTNYFVHRLQEVIPGLRYLGNGEAYLMHHGKRICFMEYGKDADSTNLLDSAIRHYLAPQSIHGKIADRIVVVNRWSPCGDRSLFNDTRGLERRFIEVLVPPPVVDIDFVREHMLRHGLIEGKTPMERFILGAFTEPGMYALLPGEGLPSVARYDIATLRALGGNSVVELARSVTFVVVSDLHVGNTKEEHVRGPLNKGALFDMTGAFLRLLRGEGAKRVHHFFIPDDIAHGLNHNYEVETDGARLSIPELEALRRKALRDAFTTRSVSKLQAAHVEAWNFLIDQILKCGIYRIEDQLRKFLHLTALPNVDVLAEIIQSFARSRIELIGPSRIMHTDTDMRDLPAIMLGNGNHFANSGIRDKNGLSEGFIITEALKQALIPLLPPHLAAQLGVHSPLVGAPLLGQNTFGCARLHIPGGGCYGVAVRGSPARYGNANGYGLVQTSANELERGNYNDIFHDVSSVLAFYGDKHKTGARDVPGYRLIQCGTFATEDAYSHHGFARVHNAAVIVSVPAGGPATGPMVTTFVPTPWIKKHIEQGTTPNWEAIIPNPL